mgnify:CR=1 FL=1
MKDTFKQFIELRKQATISAEFFVAKDLIRKLTPEQMDRLSRISPQGEKKQDFYW